MATPSSGLFVSIEGGEAVGKSTLITALQDLLQAYSIPTTATREPGGTPFAEKIRTILLSDDASPAPYAELLAMLSARADHLDKVIIPALSANKVLLCDRFIDSTIAYQGGGRALGFEEVRDLCLQLSGSLLPKITFLLDLPIEIAYQRQKKRDSPVDRFEGSDHAFYESVRHHFLRLAREFPQRIHLIDASLPQKDVLASAWRILSHQLSIRP